MGNILSSHRSLSIANGQRDRPTGRTDHYGLIPTLLAFAGVIRFTSLSGLAGAGAIEHTLPSAEGDQPQLSPDYSNLTGSVL